MANKLSLKGIQEDFDIKYGKGMFSLVDSSYLNNKAKLRIRYNKTNEIFYRSKVDMDRGQNLKGDKKVLLLDKSNKVLTPKEQAIHSSKVNSKPKQTSAEYSAKFYARWGGIDLLYCLAIRVIERTLR